MNSLPMLARIRQVPKIIPGITEHYLRQLEAQGRLPGPYSGKTKLVNIPMLIAQIDAESLPEVSSSAVNIEREEVAE